MYELKLIYFAKELDIIVISEHEFDDIFELSDWIKRNSYEFNYTLHQPVQYIIVKK